MMGWLIYHQVYIGVGAIVGCALYSIRYTLRR